jgi:hypothetical protein
VFPICVGRIFSDRQPTTATKHGRIVGKLNYSKLKISEYKLQKDLTVSKKEKKSRGIIIYSNKMPSETSVKNAY